MKEVFVFGRFETQKFGCAAVVKCLLFVLAVLSVLNQAMLPQSGSEIREESNELPARVEATTQNLNTVNSDGDGKLLVKLEENQDRNESSFASKEELKEELIEIKNVTSFARKEELKEELMEITENVNSTNTGTEILTTALDIKEKLTTDMTERSTVDMTEKSTEINLTLFFNESENPVENRLIAESNLTQSLAVSDQGNDQATNNSDTTTQTQSIVCDYSHRGYNMCSLQGEVRILGNSLNILLESPSPNPKTEINSTYKIRPFTRKWEDVTMSHIKEITIQQSNDPDQSPPCDVKHDVPLLVFATGGFPFNLFHDYTDLLIPLFDTTFAYNGQIQFAVTNYNWQWIEKYKSLIETLTHYPIINLETDTLVNCFPSAQVGLRSQKALAIDRSVSPNGYTIQDFRQFIRTALSLDRAQIERIDKNSGKRPKLCILLRKGTRAFTNEEEIIAMAESVGFETVRADTETTKDFPRIAHIVNSCDVLMGLHGAGMANMLYLPNNATLIQILPWGDLRDIGWGDYGKPTFEMGVNYVEYEIREEESTLIEKYPRDHPVLRNPPEIHKQGWNAMYYVYLVEQNVKLDVERFRGVLVDLFRSLEH